MHGRNQRIFTAERLRKLKSPVSARATTIEVRIRGVGGQGAHPPGIDQRIHSRGVEETSAVLDLLKK
jgi:hypothetical protein